MKILMTLALAVMAVCQAQGANMKIVDKGKSEYVIIVPKEPSAAETLAAVELSKYIAQMSRVKLTIKQGGLNVHKSLVVCDVANLDGLIGSQRLAEYRVSGESYSLSADAKGNILLIGGTGRSTLYAVYDFLDRLGCRFLAPELKHYQGKAEVIPQKKSLVIDLSTPVVEKPALTFRKLYVEEGHSHNAENLAQMVEWMPKARFNTLVIPTNYQGADKVKWDNWREKLTPELQKREITIEVGGHGYQNFLNAEMENGAIFDKHQEWFGVDDTGKRTKLQNRVFCTSNPDAVKYVSDNVIAYLKARPEIAIFDFWPPDGAKWCECDKCKALGTPSNRQAILISQVKDLMRKAGVTTRLETIAYAAAVTPPETAKLDKDLLMDFCPIAQCFEVQINDPSSDKNADYVKQLKGLRKGYEGDLSIYSYYRKYAWRSLPNLIPHYMQKDLQFYRTIPTQGISSYAEPGDWFTYELNHYVLGNLAWNPDADVDALVKKFAEVRYGSASKAAVHAYTVLEDVVRHYCNIPGTSLKSVMEIADAKSKLSDVEAELKTAQSQTQDLGLKKNIYRLLLTMEYARLDMSVMQSKASQFPKAEIQSQVKAVADFMAAHDEDGITTSGSRSDYPRLLKFYGVPE